MIRFVFQVHFSIWDRGSGWCWDNVAAVKRKTMVPMPNIAALVSSRAYVIRTRLSVVALFVGKNMDKLQPLAATE